MIREGLHIYKDILFLVTLGTGCLILDAESLGAVVACAAALAGLHVLHGHDVSALLHLEKTGLMAISTLVPFVSVDLAVKHNLSSSLAVEFNRLAGRDCKSGHRHRERYDHHEGQYE